MHRALFLLLLACGSPPPPPAPIVAVPASASAAPRAPDSPATRKVAVEVPAPAGPCLVDADAPRPVEAFGLANVYVGDVAVAHTRSLGDMQHARISFTNGKKEAAVAVDGTIASVRGTARDVVLYPRSRVVRAGWLSYHSIQVASVRGAEVEPVTVLPAWVAPASDFAKTPFFASCDTLTPFGTRHGLENDAAMTGNGVPLEDDAGTKLATLDAPKDGLPVVQGKTVKGRTHVVFAAGDFTNAEGWVAARHVKRVVWGGIGYGTGRGRLRYPASLTCEGEVPLHVRIGETTYAFGMLHAHQKIEGKVDDDGSFAAATLGGADDAAPFVPEEHVRTCRVEARAR